MISSCSDLRGAAVRRGERRGGRDGGFFLGGDTLVVVKGQDGSQLALPVSVPCLIDIDDRGFAGQGLGQFVHHAVFRFGQGRKPLVGQFAFHGQGCLHLLGHEGERLVLHGFGIGHEKDPHRMLLADPPGTAAGLPQGEYRIAALKKDDGGEIQQIEPGFHQVRIAQQTVVLTCCQIVPQPLFPFFRFDGMAAQDQRRETVRLELFLQGGEKITGAGVLQENRRLAALFPFRRQNFQQPFFLGKKIEIEGRRRSNDFLYPVSFQGNYFLSSTAVRIGEQTLEHFPQKPHVAPGQGLLGCVRQVGGQLMVLFL